MTTNKKNTGSIIARIATLAVAVVAIACTVVPAFAADEGIVVEASSSAIESVVAAPAADYAVLTDATLTVDACVSEAAVVVSVPETSTSADIVVEGGEKSDAIDATITGATIEGAVVEDSATIEVTDDVNVAVVETKPEPTPAPKPAAPAVEPEIRDDFTVTISANAVPLAGTVDAKKAEKIVEFDNSKIDDGIVRVKLLKKFATAAYCEVCCASEDEDHDCVESIELKLNKWVEIQLDEDCTGDISFVVYRATSNLKNARTIDLAKAILKEGTTKVAEVKLDK